MLPQDIMDDIFYRLPAKAVGRFRCLSKHWCHFLSQPNFIKNHIKRTKIRPRDEESLILISKDLYSLYITQLNNTHVTGYSTIVAKKLSDFKGDRLPSIKITQIISCDGLVLVGDYGKWFLLNPTTRELKAVPSSPYALSKFDVYGLGYDSVSDDYKILAVTYEIFDMYKERFVNIYSVRTGTWKKIECSPSMMDFGDNGMSYETINGCIHCTATAEVDSPFIIEAFDFATERFGEVPPPSSFDIWKFGFTHRVAILKGCVCLFREQSENGESDVWMMNEYGVQDSWTRFTIIDPEESELRLLCMLGKDQLVMFKGENCPKLAMYNMEEQSFKDIETNGFCVGGTRMFIESLVSPHCAILAIEEC